MKDSPQPHCSSAKPSVPQDGTGARPLTYVGILEDKALIQLVLYPVHLAPYDAEQGFTVYQDLHAILLHSFVEGARFRNVLEVIRQS